MSMNVTSLRALVTMLRDRLGATPVLRADVASAAAREEKARRRAEASAEGPSRGTPSAGPETGRSDAQTNGTDARRP